MTTLAGLVVVLMIQGYVCTQICFDLAQDKMDEGVAGMFAGVLIARGAAVALIAGRVLYFMLCDNEKIKNDYAFNKEQQRKEDEEIAFYQKQLEEARKAFDSNKE